MTNGKATAEQPTAPGPTPDQPVDGLAEQRDGHTAVLVLARPQARNAISPELAQRIESRMDALEADPGVWAIVLTGVPPVFCAGADLKAVNDGRITELSTRRGGFAGLAERQRTKPLIVAADGPALAGGCELVLAADMVVASTSASFGLPEVKRGLVAGAGGMFRLGRRIPVNIAMQCVLTGDPISAERAAEFGLVNVLCEPGGALTAALELASAVCANAPLAVQTSRAITAEATFGPDDEAWRRSHQAIAAMMATEDVQEGVRAFLEKRPPRWTGR